MSFVILGNFYFIAIVMKHKKCVLSYYWYTVILVKLYSLISPFGTNFLVIFFSEGHYLYL